MRTSYTSIDSYIASTADLNGPKPSFPHATKDLECVPSNIWYRIWRARHYKQAHKNNLSMKTYIEYSMCGTPNKHGTWPAAVLLSRHVCVCLSAQLLHSNSNLVSSCSLLCHHPTRYIRSHPPSRSTT
jgi:hypothetical protein